MSVETEICKMDTTNIGEHDWIAECSDEESYFEPDVPYRTSAEGVRIWEPSGEEIVQLYQEVQSKGFNELEWQSPGKISPSQLNQLNADDLTDVAENNLTNSDQMKSEFDFDNEFDDPTFNKSNTRVTKRTQAIKKSQTDLSKVMQDIKKYQMIGNVQKSKSGGSFHDSVSPTKSQNTIQISNTDSKLDDTLQVNLLDFIEDETS